MPTLFQYFTLSHSIPARKEELQPFCPHYSSPPANRPYLPVIMYMPHLPNYSRAPQALTNVKKQHAHSTTRPTKITKAPTMFFLRAVGRDRALTVWWIHMGAGLSVHIDHVVSSAPHHSVLLILLY